MHQKQDYYAIQKDYEDFVYIVSHDFKTPLRHLKEFTNLFLEFAQDNLLPEQETYAKFLRQSLTTLDKMQSALLTYSRLRTHAEENVPVAINDLLHEVLDELSQRSHECRSCVEFGVLPVVSAERNQLYVLFTQLIENALLYKKDGIQPKIRITHENKAGLDQFCISDNGMGIHSDYHKDVFKLFRRLHAPGSYGDGVGVGLTFAKKIVERNGGEIWIESKLLQGTKVYFTIPR